MGFTYRWNLSDLKDVQPSGLKAFSTFACGGGSTMGYKMAGIEVVGANDIDPEMAAHYKENHKPKHYFLEDIRTFRKREDLPEELFDLDILDGSPPCSSFSTSGQRHKGWSKKKKFREGQADQILDDLFFEFIALAKRLQPKVVIAENVKGMISGKAKGYVKQVIKEFRDAGYNVQLFLLNAASMGVPQARERVFFICSRNDLDFGRLSLGFNEKSVSIREAFGEFIDDKGKDFQSSTTKKYYDLCEVGKLFSSVHPKKSLFNLYKLNPDKPCPTLTATGAQNHLFRWDTMHGLTKEQVSLIGSYPMDYKFLRKTKPGYMIGMSVPPLMTYKIALEIKRQWFKEV